MMACLEGLLEGKAIYFKKLACPSVCVSNFFERRIELVARVQKSLGGSRRVWKGLEVSLVGPGRIPGGSKDSGGFEKSRPS